MYVCVSACIFCAEIINLRQTLEAPVIAASVEAASRSPFHLILATTMNALLFNSIFSLLLLACVNTCNYVCMCL